MRGARWLGLFGILVLVGILFFAVPVERDPAGGVVLRAALAALLLTALAVAIVAQVRHAMVDADGRVDGLVAAIALVWVAFSIAFYFLHLRRPEEIVGLETRIDALYFVASTMLTVGYGDVHAAGQLARGLVVVQMMFDVIFVATAGALLSARMRSRAARRAVDRSADRERQLPPTPPRQG